MKAVSKLIATILGNTAAIGLGIGLYEGKAAYAYFALIVGIIACVVEWGAESDIYLLAYFRHMHIVWCGWLGPCTLCKYPPGKKVK